MKTYQSVATFALAMLVVVGCGKNTSNTPPPEGAAPSANPTAAAPAATAPAATTPAAASTAATVSAGGLQWQAPTGWAIQPERPMRAATYSVPAAAGDPEPGEIAVFYFGPNEGGGVQANIDRWISQIVQPDGSASASKAKRGKLQGAVPVTTVDLTGTYLASSGPMMQVSAEKPGFRLVGAIAEGPNGAVFFKFTGPEKTVEAHATAFLDMVKSVTKE